MTDGNALRPNPGCAPAVAMQQPAAQAPLATAQPGSAVTTDVGKPGDPPPAPKPAGGHLHQIDLFRLLTFACVILVHAASEATMLDSAASQSAQLLLHFTREAFFTLTGFVLAYQALRRPLPARRFWRRRFPLVAVPYVVWTLLYWGVHLVMDTEPRTLGDALLGLPRDLLLGTGWYHLYFLLVTLQVYLLFPALRRLLHATVSYHKWVLVASAAVQVVAAGLLVDPPVPAGAPADAWLHLTTTILAYQFYPILGAIAAIHYDVLHAWIRRHRAMITLLFLVAITAAEGVYWYAVGLGTPPALAAWVFHPPMIIVFVAIIAFLYMVSSWWADRRREGSVSARIITYGSDRSFAIFLAHPLILVLLLPATGWLSAHIGSLASIVSLYCATVFGTVLLADVLRRIPGSKALTGRPRVRRAAAASNARGGDSVSRR